MTVTPLSDLDLMFAALLVLLNAGLSIVLRLGLARTLLIATARMVVQLALVGLVLVTLFSLVSPWLTLAAMAVMLGFAGYEIQARQDRRLAGFWSYGLGAGAITIAATLVTLLALTTQVRPDPWWSPRIAIPLLGMILGNAMTGISLGLNTFTTAVVDQRHRIEAQLALGMGGFDAVTPMIRQALRSGLMPTINAMAATGLVFLPGMMTGQILAGVDPPLAVRYQLLIMFLIAGATGLGVLIAVLGASRRVIDERERLRLDRIGPSRL